MKERRREDGEGEIGREREKVAERVKEQNRKTRKGNCGLLVAREDTWDGRRKVKEGEDEKGGRAQLPRGRKSIDFAS